MKIYNSLLFIFLMCFLFIFSCDETKKIQLQEDKINGDIIINKSDTYIKDGDTIIPVDDKKISPDTTINPFPAKELHIKIINPGGNKKAMWMGNTVVVTGIVFGAYDKIQWMSSTGATGKAAGSPFWQTGPISLIQGDNVITVTAIKGETEARDSVVVTYNPFFLFGDFPDVRPNALFIGETTTVIFTAPLSRYSNFDPNSVQLIQVDKNGNTIKTIGTMKDDGIVHQSGDEIQKDGIYTLQVPLICSNEEPLYFRVTLSVKSGYQKYTAYSSVIDIECVARLSVAECTAHQKALADARNAFNSALQKGENILSAKQAALDVLKNDPYVKEAGINGEDNSYGIWIYFKTGVLGALNLADASVRGGGGEGKNENNFGVITDALSGSQPVLSKKTMLLSPFSSQFGGTDEIPFIFNIMEKISCPYYDVEGAFLNIAANLKKFRHLNEAGIIAISSHGDTYFKDLSFEVKEKFGWVHNFSQEVLWSGEPVNCGNLLQSPKECSGDAQCPQGSKCLITKAQGAFIKGICFDYTQVDLKRGRIVMGNTGYGILPSFILHYSKPKFPNSLVYLGTCRSLWNGTLASHFFAGGAKVVAGFSDRVTSIFAQKMGQDFFAKMVEEKNIAGEAFGVGGADPQNPKSFFMFFGARNLNISDENIINPSFETGDLTGWKKEGDGRVVSKLGVAKPVSGKFMGIISTGLGYTIQTGTIEQTFCIPKGTNQFTFYWKYYSEEFHEWCGSIYQDTFTAKFISLIGGQEIEVVDVAVDDLCLPSKCIGCGKKYVGLIPSDVQFDQGDTHKIDWQKATINVSNIAGIGPVTLQFFCTDKGDSIYDTVVLIDHLKFE